MKIFVIDNNKRRHSAIENKRPADLFLGERA